MTRINCVPVECLSPKHKLAEFKEITRPFNKVINRIKKGKKIPKLDGNYRLGEGHETFFFNKLAWLWHRRHELFDSLTSDGVNVNEDLFWEIQNSFLSDLKGTPYWNDWEPTPEDMYINMARLCHRHFKTDLSEFN